MHLAGDTRADRRSNEVMYYGQPYYAQPYYGYPVYSYPGYRPEFGYQ